MTLLGYVVVLMGVTLFWTTTSWPIGQLMQLGVPTWVSPLLLAEMIQCVVVVGGFLFISRVSARQIGLRWDAVPSGLVGGLLVWVLAQAIALGPAEAIVAGKSATPLLLTVPEAPGLLLAYAAVGILEETEFRGILLGQSLLDCGAPWVPASDQSWHYSPPRPSLRCCIFRPSRRLAGPICGSCQPRCRKWRSRACRSGCATS